MRDFPGRPVVKTSSGQSSTARGEGSIPGQGTKILHSIKPKKNEEEEKEWRNMGLLFHKVGKEV